MKFSHEHYTQLCSDLDKAVNNITIDGLQDHWNNLRAGKIDCNIPSMRFRWDLFWYAIKGLDIYRDLPYNDNHIDTAINKYCSNKFSFYNSETKRKAIA